MGIADANPRSLLRDAGTALFDSGPADRVLRGHRNRLVDGALEQGLEPALEAPLRYLASGDLPADAGQAAERIEELRLAIAARETTGLVGPDGQRISLRRAALSGSVNRRFGSFLHLCARALGARTVVELGSCVGIGTAYLASAGPERVISIEASPERAAIARETAARVSDRVEIVLGRFADVLPGLLDELETGVDLAWVDGHHRLDPTLRYFDLLRPKLSRDAILAFDDIRVSAEMRDAWNRLRHAAGFADTIDLGQLGLGVWRGGGTVPRTHDLRGIRGRPRWLHAGAGSAERL